MGIENHRDREPELEFAVDDQPSRYSRHILLSVVGEQGQERIQRARVLVAGLGALGEQV
jgi:molybdopterin/thiamine biosynthesis adenylyltransferase